MSNSNIKPAIYEVNAFSGNDNDRFIADWLRKIQVNINVHEYSKEIRRWGGALQAGFVTQDEICTHVNDNGFHPGGCWTYLQIIGLKEEVKELRDAFEQFEITRALEYNQQKENEVRMQGLEEITDKNTDDIRQINESMLSRLFRRRRGKEY